MSKKLLILGVYPVKRGHKLYRESLLKATRNKYPTYLASIFVRLQRCRNSCVARYAPISTPPYQDGAGFEDKQKSCAIWVVYLLRVT